MTLFDSDIGPNVSFGDIAIAVSNGILYGSAGASFFTYDLNTPAVITVIAGATATGMQIAFGADGILYGYRV